MWISALTTLTALCGMSVAQELADITPPRDRPINAIPRLGLGTFAMEGEANTTAAIAGAIEAGYRHIDAASIYRNEQNVGKGIKEGLRRTGLKRSDLWITTKLWTDRAGNQVERGLRESLQRLGLDYIDLYMIHFPVDTTGGGRAKFNHVETWKAVEKLMRPNGTVRYIGVANFSPKQMEELLAASTIRPKVHQFELHPYLQQSDFIAWHFKNNITVTGYAPLGNTSPFYRASGTRFPPLLQNPVMQEVANARNCTTAQVSLAWNMRRGVSVIPKSSQLAHQKENLAAYGSCKLTDDDSAKIKAMEAKWAGRMNNPCRMMNPRMPCFEGLFDPRAGLD